MEKNTEKPAKSTFGGYRPGSGRKKGQTNKITAKDILETCESMTGKPFIVNLMEGYIQTINEGDIRNRVVYEKIILDKTASTMLEAEITDSKDTIKAKETAFAEALAKLVNIQQTDK